MRVDEIKIRLFVEGVLLSRLSEVSVTCNANETATARFTFPAVPGFRGEDLKRARVHIFWSDDLIRRTRNVDEWPMLFDGEIVSDMLEKGVSHRNIGFFCSGHSTYWHQCKLYFYELGSTYNNQAGELGGAFEPRRAAFFGNEKVTLESRSALAFQKRIISIFNDETLTLQGKVRKIFKEALPVNYFFDKSNGELKLDRRFVAPRDSQVEAMFFSLDVLTRLIDNQVAAYAGDTPMIRVLKDALSRFKYQVINNCQPVLVKGVKEYIQRVQAERDELLRQLDEQFAVHFKLEDPATGSSLVSETTKHLDEAGINENSTDADLEVSARELYIPMLNDIVEGDTDRMNDEEIRLNDQFRYLTPSEQDFRLETLDEIRQEEALKFLVSIRDEIKRLRSNSFVTDKNALDVPPDGDPPDELAQMMLLPETDYAAVPACNVIFPVSQMNFGIQRDYLAEPTRLITTVPGIGGVSQAVFMSPEQLRQAVIPQDTVEPTDEVEGYSLPVTPVKITSPYGGRRHPVTGDFKQHKGIDFRARTGQSVFAFDAGTVVRAGYAGNAGNMIVINHGDISSVYMHLSEMLVSQGQKVTSGQLIGRAGATGRVTGPHLHFEIIRGRKKVDPTPFIAAAQAEAERRAAGNASDAGEDRVGVDAEEEAIQEIGNQNSQFQSSLPDYKYLTPEEQVTGIVAEYDHGVDQTMAFFEHGSSPQTGAETPRDRYLRQTANTRFLDLKYSRRRFYDMPMPFNPFPIAGFPVLVIDKARSVIGKAVSVTHTVSVGGGSGNASSTVSIEKPRFWNEGDPYFWRGGEGDDFVPSQAGGSSRSVKLPNAAKATFPAYYNASFVDTNTFAGAPSSEPFGGARWGKRPVDELYQAMLGVNAVPYRYTSDVSPTLGVERSYNAFVDEVDDSGRRPNHTLVGRYYNLLDKNEELAQNFVRSFTQRTGITEKEMFVTFLGSTYSRGAYRGNAFRNAETNRPDYQGVVQALVQTLVSEDAFRG